MVVLPSNRQEKAPVAVTMDDPRCRLIASRYGTIDNLYTMVTAREPSAETPSLIMCMKTYGAEPVRRQLSARMKMAVVRMGEVDLDDADATIIGEAIAEDDEARVLGYDLVLGFFKALETGRYELYSCKPRHVMAAWRKYAASAHMLQTRLKEQAEREQRDREYEQHRKQCITLKEYKRRTAGHK